MFRRLFENLFLARVRNLPRYPRTLPARWHHPREYVRSLHLAAKFWKLQDRSSYRYQLARAEARLAQWAYEAWLQDTSLQLLHARIETFKPGWPGVAGSVQSWRDGAEHLLKTFRGQS